MRIRDFPADCFHAIVSRVRLIRCANRSVAEATAALNSPPQRLRGDGVPSCNSIVALVPPGIDPCLHQDRHIAGPLTGAPAQEAKAGPRRAPREEPSGQLAPEEGHASQHAHEHDNAQDSCHRSSPAIPATTRTSWSKTDASSSAAAPLRYRARLLRPRSAPHPSAPAGASVPRRHRPFPACR